MPHGIYTTVINGTIRHCVPSVANRRKGIKGAHTGDEICNSPEEAVERAMFNDRKMAAEDARQKQLQAHKQLADDDQEAYLSCEGFTDNMPPRRRAIVAGTLNTLVRRDKKIMTRKQAIRQLVTRWYKPGTWKGFDNAMIGPDNTAVTTLTKTGCDYAQHLIQSCKRRDRVVPVLGAIYCGCSLCEPDNDHEEESE